MQEGGGLPICRPPAHKGLHPAGSRSALQSRREPSTEEIHPHQGGGRRRCRTKGSDDQMVWSGHARRAGLQVSTTLRLHPAIEHPGATSLCGDNREAGQLSDGLEVTRPKPWSWGGTYTGEGGVSRGRGPLPGVLALESQGSAIQWGHTEVSPNALGTSKPASGLTLQFFQTPSRAEAPPARPAAPHWLPTCPELLLSAARTVDSGCRSSELGTTVQEPQRLLVGTWSSDPCPRPERPRLQSSSGADRSPGLSARLVCPGASAWVVLDLTRHRGGCALGFPRAGPTRSPNLSGLGLGVRVSMMRVPPGKCSDVRLIAVETCCFADTALVRKCGKGQLFVRNQGNRKR
ncbi:uncharacterized protein LOC128625839 [Artibeus jamaicensis]|uniref:uncharacterized protein LOC128625839 n=1 Tax=Artibeus jamaicensis TaxID=9417 RepID=UPI00235AFC0C|nr:uncharacterized protein LOC128625839 [Artibeus jamaicensis]